MENDKYSKAGIYYLIGNLFNKGLAFLTIPIFTRILTVYDYGIVNTYAAWVGIMTMILGMATHMGIRSAFTDYKENIDEFISTVTVFNIISSFVITTIILLSIYISNNTINILLVAFCFVESFSMAIIQNYSMYLMMKIDYKKRTLLLVFPGLISALVGVLVIVYVIKSKLYLGKIIPSMIINSLFAIIIIVTILNSSNKKFNKEFCIYALKISVPIILHGLSLNILAQSDRIMITYFRGATETGVYSLIYNICMISMVISASLEGIWIPWFLQKIKEKSIEIINEKVILYIETMSIVTIGVMLLSPEILKVMAPSNYWYGLNIIPFVVLSSYVIFIYTLYVNVEHFHKKTKRIATNTLVAAVFNIGLNAIFIPSYGIYAAAATTLISYIISFYLHYIYSKKIEPELFNISIFFKPVLIIVISSIIFYCSIQYIYIRWALALVILILFMYIRREHVIRMINNKKLKS